MNTTTVTAELPRTRNRLRWAPRLVSAEFLKLRKRRGLVVSTLALTVAPMIIAYAVLLGLDGPAGGLENFAPSLNVLTQLSAVAAILVGATVGAGDLRAGVFRELVVTGRSRLALFGARVPAGLALLIPIVGGAFAITATAATVFAGSLEVDAHAVVDFRAPSGALLVHSAGWLGLVTSLSFVLALGVSSLIGSRGTSIGILLGWQLVAMPLLLQIGALGWLREGVVLAAWQRLQPTTVLEGDPVVPMSFAAALVVIVVWTVVPLALGAWRTHTRDA